jgi:hypothetical protein
MSETSFDPNRRLCPDGSCVGVIGPDGRCGVCGRTSDGKPRVLAGGAADGATFDDDPDDHASAAEAQPAPMGQGGGQGDGQGGGFDSNRRLCDDGSCVGLIGPDGRCNVCGRQAA